MIMTEKKFLRSSVRVEAAGVEEMANYDDDSAHMKFESLMKFSGY